MKEKPSTIWIRPSTKKQLEKMGERGESYEDIILKLIAKQNAAKIPLEIKGIKLYRQGVEASIFYGSIPYNVLLGKLMDHKSTFAYYEGKKNYGYWDFNKATQDAKEIILKHIKNIQPLQQTIKKWEIVIEKQKIIEKEIKELDQKSNQEINDLLRRLVKKSTESWEISLIVELFDPNSEDIITELLNNYDASDLSQKEFKVLCSPKILTSIQKETISLCKIGNEKNEKELEQHTKNFFWIKNSWGKVYSLDKNFFKEKISRLEEEGLNFKLKVEKVKHNLNYLEKEKQVILKQKTLTTEIKKAIEFFSLMTIWREKRKKCTLITNHYLGQILTEVAKRTKTDPANLLFSSAHELNIPLTLDYLEELKKRQEGCINFRDENKEYYLTGKIAKEFMAEVNKNYGHSTERLYGNVANPGKIEGIAKVIFTTDDLHKMQKGDILVSPCTRPEYISAMEKASAILTDEGGITSHAAIVSRELGVPCIVGLQNATDAIKDGDLLEVNANHGIVTVKK